MTASLWIIASVLKKNYSRGLFHISELAIDTLCSSCAYINISAHRHLNKLKNEKSPYLLQHKDNPVDWYPWGEEAFKKAKEENKPVFLSIGYATCHWCHVMAHESFEDPEIAEVLNEAFINVKVDREERPDIDSTYMTVCQMLTGHGGWPLTIIMTPEKKPFFAGTYIPKEARFNRIGLRQLIPGIKGMWKHEPEKIRKAVDSIQDGFSKSLQFEKGPFPGTEALDYAAEQLTTRFDGEFGGFGSAPKFPTPHNLMFLLREWEFKKDNRFKAAVEHTLTSMRLGGIWDHIGFGFHRYSTDREWLLPHFEKMLYDQALLMMAYTEGWQVSENPLFKQTVQEIAEYIFRDLQHKNGAFYSAEDADSEGEEGKFYVWNLDEIDQELSAKDSEWFKKTFRLRNEGNFKDEATRQFTGQNIPHLKNALSDKEKSHFESIRTQLFEKRGLRIRPQLDDKVLTDWNALMIAALAKAGAVFENVSYLEAAEKAYQFIHSELFVDGKLLHRYKDGDAAIDGFADDYAFLTWASIELYEATFKTEYLTHALELNRIFIDRFWDKTDGGFYLSNYDEDQPLGKQKQIYDGAVPSSNSVAMLNLIRLSRLTGQTELEELANQIGTYFSNDLIRAGSSVTLGLQAVQFLNYNPKEIVIAEGNTESHPFISLFHSEFIPQKVLVLKKKGDDALIDIAPYTKSQNSVDNKTAVYVCENYSCTRPVTTLSELREALSK